MTTLAGMKTKRVGAKELRKRLGTYLRLVQRGATIEVTERGRPVAELRGLVAAPSPKTLDEKLDQLAAEGLITRGTGKPLRPFKRIKLKGGPSIAETIMEDREDRF